MIADCPKSMTFGPCGGVGPDAGCEVDRRPCPFLAPVQARVLSEAADRRHSDATHLVMPSPTVVVDVRAPSGWVGDVRRVWRRTAEGLSGCVALLGEHVDNPRRQDDAGPLDATVAVEILSSHDVPVVATVTGRDRDLEAAAVTMRRLAAAGAVAIHCVTGDHPAALSIDRPAWFGAEAVSLVRIANDIGLAATVGESPASLGPRAERVRLKARAGASMCILNHAGDATELVAFVDACRQLDVDTPFVGPIPMVGDAAAAAGLEKFPGLNLPPGFIGAILGAEDPLAVGIERASSLTAEIASSRRFAGVNLSGSAAGSDPYQRIESMGRFIVGVRTAWAAASQPASPGSTVTTIGEVVTVSTPDTESRSRRAASRSGGPTRLPGTTSDHDASALRP